MKRTGIDVEIHPEGQYILFRLKGVVYARDVLDKIAETYSRLEEPWQYDQLYDVRALINIFVYADFVAISDKWREMVGTYRPLHFAIVTTDPLRIDRAHTFGLMFDNIEAKTFPTVEAAAAWLTPVAVRQPHES